MALTLKPRLVVPKGATPAGRDTSTRPALLPATEISLKCIVAVSATGFIRRNAPGVRFRGSACSGHDMRVPRVPAHPVDRGPTARRECLGEDESSREGRVRCWARLRSGLRCSADTSRTATRDRTTSLRLMALRAFAAGAGRAASHCEALEGPPRTVVLGGSGGWLTQPITLKTRSGRRWRRTAATSRGWGSPASIGRWNC